MKISVRQVRHVENLLHLENGVQHEQTHELYALRPHQIHSRADQFGRFGSGAVLPCLPGDRTPGSL